MKFPAHKIGLYLDWRTQEVGVAAARSGDAATGGGLCGRRHLSRAGVDVRPDSPQDAKSWKATPEGKSQRQRMKALQLGINYGMGVSVFVTRARPASDDRQRGHHSASATLPDISGSGAPSMVERAMLERVIVSEFDGWPLHLSHSPNKRTLYNFPMQSRRRRDAAAGRQPTVRRPTWCRSCWCTTASCSNSTARSRSQHAIEIMRAAGTEVCGGLEIGVDVDQKLIGGARYRDKRPVASKMWNTVMETLDQIGALSKVAT